MKKILFTLVAVFVSLAMANAQFKVLGVNADFNYYEYDLVANALANSGFTYDTLTPDTILSYDFLKDYNMVFWYAGNDGVDTLLWDPSDTAGGNYGNVKFTEGLMEYIANGGILWIDGLDVIYDIYGSAPDTFSTGDFLYDVMGIAVYAAQSKADDGGSGVPYMLVADSAKDLLPDVDTVKWTYSTLWYADALDITDDANPLFVMGGADDYPLKGKVSGLYKYNVVYTSLRLGKAATQEIADNVVKDILTAAQNGAFQPAPVASNVNDVNYTTLKIYPNPASGFTFLSLPGVNTATVTISDMAGRTVLTRTVNGSSYLNISGLQPGIYTVTVKSDKNFSTGKLIVK